MTFLDDEFYKKPFCSQEELALHWQISISHLKKLEDDGLIRRVESIGAKKVKYPVKRVMEIEGLKEDISLIDYRRLKRENKLLKEQLQEATEKLGSIKILLSIV